MASSVDLKARSISISSNTTSCTTYGGPASQASSRSGLSSMARIERRPTSVQRQRRQVLVWNSVPMSKSLSFIGWEPFAGAPVLNSGSVEVGSASLIGLEGNLTCGLGDFVRCDHPFLGNLQGNRIPGDKFLERQSRPMSRSFVFRPGISPVVDIQFTKLADSLVRPSDRFGWIACQGGVRGGPNQLLPSSHLVPGDCRGQHALLSVEVPAFSFSSTSALAFAISSALDEWALEASSRYCSL